MRRSAPATRQLTAIGAQKRPIEELTPEDASAPEVGATPEVAEVAEVESENDKPRGESQK